MSQQLAIILMVDVEAALKDNTLEGNTYLFDNMKLQGSEGLGTGKLISAINGISYYDGSQADKQILNWLPYGVGSLPPTLPKSFLADKSKNSDLNTIEDFKALAERIETNENSQFTDIASVVEELKKISSSAGVKAKVQSKFQGILHDLGISEHKIMDITGELITIESEGKIPEINSLTPIITGISGEAVDKNIIYPAAYGSPDMVTDGWYWSASVDTYRPGTYAYTMDVQLYKLSHSDGQWRWIPVHMRCEAYIRITNDFKKNGFTNAGVGSLPLPII
ncbi:MAG: hypothetical protein HC899_37850 [Leptolyngbyaceae cyanobacterium SM1_4_3]|nr:hypothetical protein [Leptolyngbyaceae cyanobacterium SM1_4_3]